MINPGLAAWKLSFQLSPIILTNGIATPLPGSALPIISITEAANFAEGILSGANSDLDNLDNFFANFKPVAGATLIDEKYGTYPFANQTVAANAGIAQPLAISMLMECPVRGSMGYYGKLATMEALQTTLQEHIQQGGTFTVLTPSSVYANCLLTRLVDAGSGETKQPQIRWQWDFTQPLLTLEQAQQAQNSLMSKLSSGTMVTPDSNGNVNWSGLSPTVGVPNSLASPSVVTAASNTAGSSVGGISSLGTGSGVGAGLQ